MYKENSTTICETFNLFMEVILNQWIEGIFLCKIRGLIKPLEPGRDNV
jgi:hypothetical protein